MTENATKSLAEMSLAEIAREVRKDWKKISPYAQPYVDAMSSMQSITENYILDSGSEIVARFLCNATGWRGDVARQVKAELKSRLKTG